MTWRSVLGGLAVAAALTGCDPPPALPPQAPPAAPQGQMTLGRIVAIRSVRLSDAQGGAALNQVLSALGQKPAALPQSGQEVLVRQDNGNVVAIAQPDASGFAVGDEVGIIAAGQTTLIHR